MRTDTAFVLTVLVLCYAVVSGLVKRWYIAPALIFVAFGMALGPFGFGVIEAGADTASFTVLAQLALTVILFNQAAMLDLPSVVRRGHITFRLLVIGMPLAIVLGTVVALLVLPQMPLWEAVCVAAIVAPTEVALIDALLEDRRIPERVRHALSVESGCYDGSPWRRCWPPLRWPLSRTTLTPVAGDGSPCAPKWCRSPSGSVSA
jgi:sodium/hydrogen antiporter